ncbi:hypothetical protein GCM10020260_17690 [Nesterenkonia halobia]|uniref:Uncharacterized protein n=1 Tax=Nesterenkonia halobia TaxID=37922 RepID=A0ABP6REV7_9MICC
MLPPAHGADRLLRVLHDCDGIQKLAQSAKIWAVILLAGPEQTPGRPTVEGLLTGPRPMCGATEGSERGSGGTAGSDA